LHIHNINSFRFKIFIFWLQLKATHYIFFRTPKHKRLRLSAFVFGTWLLSFFGLSLASTLRSCYFWFRYIDDIIDEDLVYEGDIYEFKYRKKELLQNLNSPDALRAMRLESIDWLIIHVYYAGLRFGYDNQQSMLTLYRALEHDVDRTKERKMYYSAAETKEYFDNLDIPSVMMTFQFINEKAITLEDLQALIDMTRARYNVRDFFQDLSVGIVNIPIEDLELYNIDISFLQATDDFKSAINYLPFKQWFRDQIEYIERNLESGTNLVREKPIRVRTWLALWTCFIRPCKVNLKEWKAILA
jgi:hypothetical protein